MSDFRSQEIEFEIMGVVFDLNVEYKITSYGSSDSYYEPGDPPELEIDKVINIRTGEDMTDWLYNHHDWLYDKYKPWLSLINYPIKKGVWYDKIRSKMFDPFGQAFTRKLQWNVCTLLNKIHDIIYELEPFEYEEPFYD